MPPMGVSESCMLLTAPQEVPVVATVKRLLPAMPKRTSFPSMLILCTPSLATSGLPLLSAHCRTPKAANQDEEHHSQQHPPLAGVPHHDAEGVGQGAGNQQDQQDLDKVGERCRVFKGMGRVGVEEAAAVGAQFLDRFLGGDRPHRDLDFLDDHVLGDRLALGILERIPLVVHLWLVIVGGLDQRHGLVGAEVLDHPLGNQDK